jgi:2-(1,2-epoxy-1,2-dihydrophenyl)acetyl-CoA isomerase
MTSAPSKLKLALDGAVAIVTLNDPATLNAAGVDLAAELADALRGLGTGGQAFGAHARAVVLTGEGRAFCSGANLAAGPGGGATDADGRPDAGRALQRVYNPLLTLMRELPIPIVTAVNGAAAGIGCSFALMGDMIVASESAYFLQAFRRIGLVPDGGSTWLLPRLIGKARAMEMALMGDRVPAKTALEWGLINRCTLDDQLMPTALEIARTLAEGPASLGMIRRLMWDALEADWAAQLHAESRTQSLAGRTEDFAEGVAAFFQKRPAAFKGR